HSYKLAADEQVDEAGHPRDADRQQGRDGYAALLPDEDADEQAAHADHRQSRADDVDRAIARVRHVPDPPRTREDGEDDQALDEKSRPPREDGRDEASQQRPDRGGDRARRADQRKDPRALLADEVAVDQRLHRREVERGAEAADDGPEDDDRGQALREDHRARADQKNSRPVTKARLRPKRS